jgi:hypothetical protein
MSAYMEMIFIDSEHQARKTGIGAEFDTDRLTKLAFDSIRHLAVPIETAAFIVDYYDPDGDLADSIAVSREGFREITNQEPLSEQEYLQTDVAYWAKARARMRHARRQRITPALRVVA